MTTKSAFGCASLRTGSLIVGWVGLVWLVLRVFLLSVSSLEIQQTPAVEAHHLKQYLRSEFAVAFGFAALATLVIFSYVSLIHGAYTKSPGFLIPYLILCAIRVVHYTAALMYFFVMIMVYNYDVRTHPIEIMVEYNLYLMIGIYAFWVVLSHYKELKSIAKKLSPV